MKQSGNSITPLKLLIVISLFCITCVVNFSLAHTYCDQAPSFIGDNEGWKLKKDSHGIKVYLHKTSLSSAYTFRGVMEIEADLETVVGLIWDWAGYTDWLLLCNESESLDIISDTEQILYTVSKLPWPISKRDCVSRRRLFQDSETGVVTLEMCGIPDYIPPRKGHVRIPVLMGYGKVTQKKNGRVEVIYEVLLEPGGWVPNELANIFVVRIPYKTLRNIQAMMPLTKYQGTDISFINKSIQDAGK